MNIFKSSNFLVESGDPHGLSISALGHPPELDAATGTRIVDGPSRFNPAEGLKTPYPVVVAGIPLVLQL